MSSMGSRQGMLFFRISFLQGILILFFKSKSRKSREGKVRSSQSLLGSCFYSLPCDSVHAYPTRRWWTWYDPLQSDLKLLGFQSEYSAKLPRYLQGSQKTSVGIKYAAELNIMSKLKTELIILRRGKHDSLKSVKYLSQKNDAASSGRLEKPLGTKQTVIYSGISFSSDPIFFSLDKEIHHCSVAK